MPSADKSATIVFANCAGAVRDEQSDSKQLGQQVSKFLVREKLIDGIAAIGLAEVIVSAERGQASVKKSLEPLTVHKSSLCLDDLAAFQAGFNYGSPTSYFLSCINSHDHCHPDAIEKKWVGTDTSKRVANEFRLNRDIHQGIGAMLFSNYKLCSGLHLRAAGVFPLSVKSDDPLEYRGNRDSEPRSAIVILGMKLAENFTVDLVFCHLETNTQDKRIGKEEELEASRGVEHRIAQIDRLCKQLSNERPVILMGDFNARPGSKELDYLCENYEFLQVLPADLPISHKATTWGESYAYGKPRIDRPNYEQREAKQGWPHSHLKHEILIDHAFVRGLNPVQWRCDLKVIELPNEREKIRISDHRPIALTVQRRR